MGKSSKFPLPKSAYMAKTVTLAQLVGTWRLLSFQYVPLAGGEPALPYGLEPAGLVVFGPDGGMSMAVAAAERGAMPGSRMSSGTDEQKARAYESYLSYAGSWLLDEARQELRLMPAQSLNPNWVGVEQLRYTAWGPGGELVLRTPEFILEGMGYRGVIMWVRYSGT